MHTDSDASVISRLETQVRRLRRAFILITVVFVCLIFMGQMHKNPTSIEAQKITLKDNTGKTRIELDANNIPTINILGEDGKPRVSLTVLGGQGTLMALGDGGTALINAVATPAIGLFSGDGKFSTVLQADTLLISEKDGYAMHVGKTRTVNTRTGAETQSSVATITMYGKDGKVIWQAP